MPLLWKSQSIWRAFQICLDTAENWHGSKFHAPTNWRAKKKGPLVGPSSSHSQDAEVVCSFTEC